MRVISLCFSLQRTFHQLQNKTKIIEYVWVAYEIDKLRFVYHGRINDGIIISYRCQVENELL